jgi:hypothetical protein
MESVNKISSILTLFHCFISIRLGGLLSKLIRKIVKYFPINNIDNMNKKSTNTSTDLSFVSF